MKKTTTRKRKSAPVRSSGFLSDLDSALQKYLSALKTAKGSNLAVARVTAKKPETTN